MARKAKIAKANKLKKRFLQAIKDGRKPKNATKVFNCCSICGRTRWYLGKYGKLMLENCQVLENQVGSI